MRKVTEDLELHAFRVAQLTAENEGLRIKLASQGDERDNLVRDLNVKVNTSDQDRIALEIKAKALEFECEKVRADLTRSVLDHQQVKDSYDKTRQESKESIDAMNKNVDENRKKESKYKHHIKEQRNKMRELQRAAVATESAHQEDRIRLEKTIEKLKGKLKVSTELSFEPQNLANKNKELEREILRLKTSHKIIIDKFEDRLSSTTKELSDRENDILVYSMRLEGKPNTNDEFS